MRQKLFVPEEVKTAIRAHLSRAVEHAVAEYLSAAEDEDSLTGHLGARLQVASRRVHVESTQSERPGEWTWSVNYYKFRGRGPGASERLLGADGVFELKLVIGTRVDVKSLLFQAKIDREGGRDLLEQCIKLSTWREAAFVLSYSERGFAAISLDEVISARGSLRRAPRGTPLQEYLGREYLDCEIGDTDLFYEARQRRLRWRSMEGEVVAVPFGIRHRIGINVRAPALGTMARGIDHIISPDEIYNHRMQATTDDLLAPPRRAIALNPKQAQRSIALTYHPDRYLELDELHRQILTRRMQEFNGAFVPSGRGRRE